MTDQICTSFKTCTQNGGYGLFERDRAPWLHSFTPGLGLLPSEGTWDLTFQCMLVPLNPYALRRIRLPRLPRGQVSMVR